ncbi:cell death abnormality protein 1-like [Ostrea edulis]|uniref:cell death abnormality protein 1-like n=1 Tax=Ostrea edulis TaxID=37623 RepID=UPI0024AFB6C6|nr:cell death abnormality protein 1-like [Ostrea edulis]
MCFIMAEIMCQGVRSNQDDCRTYNSTCCYNYHFDKRTGRCVECALGSFGWNCKEDCTSGYYVYLCCSECECKAHHCDPVTGCTKSVHEYTTEECTVRGLRIERTVIQLLTS